MRVFNRWKFFNGGKILFVFLEVIFLIIVYIYIYGSLYWIIKFEEKDKRKICRRII